MPVVVAFVSQKGGVGKSTLARGLATFAASANLKTKLADLDLQQKTASVWEHARSRHAVKPALEVEAFTDLQQALQSAKSSDLLVVDTPGQIADATSAPAMTGGQFRKGAPISTGTVRSEVSTAKPLLACVFSVGRGMTG